jgi:salicylate hydroxylase
MNRVQRLVSLVPYALRAKYVKRPAVEEWVHESGRIVLIGEAAHPMLVRVFWALGNEDFNLGQPCTIHNTSLAVEDAAVFGTLFSRLRTFDQIPELLEAFQELRQARCEAVHLSELNNAALVWLPPGPERDARDAGMKKMMEAGHDHWDEGMLREQWDTIAEVFGYNAREAAEDWWVNLEGKQQVDDGMGATTVEV